MKINPFIKRPASVLAALIVGISALAGNAVAQQGTVTFASWGGSFQDALRKAMLEPAAQRLGIKIKEDTTNGIQDIRTQISAKNVTWDITEQALDVCVQLKKEGALEPLDYKVIGTDGLPKDQVDSHWVGILNYSLVMGWRTDKYGQNGPKTWADFWDVKKFPGRRAMFGKVNHNLEAALMADGVAPKDVNKVLSSSGGVDRAFKKLEQIAPHVAIWYAGGSQAAQLLKDGEVDLIHIGNGRADSIIADGAKAAYTWSQGTLDGDCVLVPKGAPNRAEAMKVINELLAPKNQAGVAALIPYGPVNSKAFSAGVLKPEQLAKINSAPANIGTQVTLNPTFYASNFDKLQERFQVLIQKK